jgi:hypothetical protein
MMPAALFLSGVTVNSGSASYTGGQGQVFKGSMKGRNGLFAIKKPNFASESDKEKWFHVSV